MNKANYFVCVFVRWSTMHVLPRLF